MKLVAKTIASRKYFDKIYKIHENKPINRLENNKNLHKNEKCVSFECRRHIAACSELIVFSCGDQRFRVFYSKLQNNFFDLE